MVTEHALYFDLKGHFCVTRSQTSCCFCLATVVHMPFVVFWLALCGIIYFRFGMAHVSASGDSIASFYLGKDRI